MREYSLYELADVVRSKNSGPFQITLDVLFSDRAAYLAVKESGTINKDSIAVLYHIAESRICDIVFFDTALGFKITFDRDVSSGTCGDRDVYGAQQHMPLGQMRLTI